MIIAVDFDGTIVENKYPKIGAPIPGAIETLQKWKERGHTIIINSCRSGVHEAQMEAWLVRNHVAHDFINQNDPERTRLYGSDCRKISADVYIDDRDIGRIIPDLGEFLPIYPITWWGYDHLIASYEKTLSTTARKTSNVEIDDVDIILGHNPLKIP